MNRIEQKFQFLRAKKKKAFIAYVTSGDPDLKTTADLVLAFEKAGVDIIELGIPFSDPLADGPTIQAASQRALENKVNINKIFTLVRKIRKESEIPIALMTYYNPIYNHGESIFIKEAAQSGVDGLIIPDLPPDEAQGLIQESRLQDLATIFFLSPTTTKDRMKKIVKLSTGFIYFVSVAGVTGARQELPQDVLKKVKDAKSLTSKPICLGFGISRPDQVQQITQIADGVIIGSAIINQIVKNAGRNNLVQNVARYVKTLTSPLSAL